MWYVLQTVDLTDAAKMASALACQFGQVNPSTTEDHSWKIFACDYHGFLNDDILISYPRSTDGSLHFMGSWVELFSWRVGLLDVEATIYHDPKIRNINGDSNASRRSLLRCCKHMSHEEASIDDHRCRYAFALSWAPLCWTFCMKLETWTTEIAKYLWSLWHLLREGSWLTMKTWHNTAHCITRCVGFENQILT